jgi:hypothetical protein
LPPGYPAPSCSWASSLEERRGRLLSFLATAAASVIRVASHDKLEYQADTRMLSLDLLKIFKFVLVKLGTSILKVLFLKCSPNFM